MRAHPDAFLSNTCRRSVCPCCVLPPHLWTNSHAISRVSSVFKSIHCTPPPQSWYAMCTSDPPLTSSLPERKCRRVKLQKLPMANMLTKYWRVSLDLTSCWKFQCSERSLQIVVSCDLHTQLCHRKSHFDDVCSVKKGFQLWESQVTKNVLLLNILKYRIYSFWPLECTL